MSLFDKTNCLPIVLGHKLKAKHMAFEGCSYYFTILCENKIIQYDTHLCLEKCYSTCREYDYICYDVKDDCFWAADKDCYNTIFKLDRCMNEIDAIVIRGCNQIGEIITGVSYNCCSDKVIVSLACGLVQVDKCCSDALILYSSNNGLITGVLSLYPGYIITVLKKSKQYVYVINHCGEMLKSTEVDCRFMIKNMIFNPCSKDCASYDIEYLIYKKGCYPYSVKQPISSYDLGYNPCFCNYKICDECCLGKPDIRCNDFV